MVEFPTRGRNSSIDLIALLLLVFSTATSALPAYSPSLSLPYSSSSSPPSLSLPLPSPLQPGTPITLLSCSPASLISSPLPLNVTEASVPLSSWPRPAGNVSYSFVTSSPPSTRLDVILSLSINCPLGFTPAQSPPCIRCPLGALCTTDGSLLPSNDFGFWLRDSDVSRVFPCLPPKACPSGAATSPDTPTTTVCASGYEGFRCAACAAATHYRLMNECEACSSSARDASAATHVLSVLAICAGLTPVLLVVARWRSRSTALVAVAITFAQTLSTFARIRLDWDERVLDLFAGLSVFNFNWELLQMECRASELTYEARWAVSMLAPVVMAAFLALSVGLYALLQRVPKAQSLHCCGLWRDPIFTAPHSARHSDDALPGDVVPRTRLLDPKALGAAARLSLPSLNGAARWDSSSDEEPESPTSSGDESERDTVPDEPASPSLSSSEDDALDAGVSPTRQFALTAVSAYMLYLNLAYFSLARKALEMFQCTYESADGEMYLDAEPSLRCYQGWWSDMLPATVLALIFYVAGIPCLFSVVLLRQYERRKYSIHATPLSRMMWNAKFFNLVKSFDEAHHYWELVLLGRKLCLVLAVVFGSGYPLLQSSLALGVLALWLAAQQYVAPYNPSGHLNLFEAVWQLSAMVVLLIGMMVYGDEAFQDDATYDAMAEFVIAIVSITLIGFAVAFVFARFGLTCCPQRARTQQPIKPLAKLPDPVEEPAVRPAHLAAPSMSSLRPIPMLVPVEDEEEVLAEDDVIEEEEEVDAVVPVLPQPQTGPRARARPSSPSSSRFDSPSASRFDSPSPSQSRPDSPSTSRLMSPTDSDADAVSEVTDEAEAVGHLLVSVRSQDKLRRVASRRHNMSSALEELRRHKTEQGRKLAESVEARREERIARDVAAVRSAMRRGSVGELARRDFANMDACMLHVRVIEASNLPAADSSGSSDPYCKIKFKDGSKQKTCVISQTLHPVWNEEFTLNLTREDFAHRPSLSVVVEVFDYDRVLRNSRLGKLEIPLSDIALTGSLHGWFPLVGKKGTSTDAKINLDLVLDEDLSRKAAQLAPDFLAHRSALIERTSIIRASVSAREVSIFVTTWNVGNAPPPDSLDGWFQSPESGSTEEAYDVYVIGAQECEYKPRPGFKSCHEDWKAALSRHLGPNYKLVGENTMWQIRLLVFVAQGLASSVNSVRNQTEATGIGHLMGNKGGVATSFNILDTSFCVVNAHLAAHQDMTARRNADVKEIIMGIKVPDSADLDVLHAYHHVIFVGDLNYRLNYGAQKRKPSPEEHAHITQMVREERFAELWAMDQLNAERNAERVFVGFNEGEPSFPPTFKVLRNEVLEYTPQRLPAWCDRILWKSMEITPPLEQLDLWYCPNVLSSDHKPVRSVFVAHCSEFSTSISPDRGPARLVLTDVRAQGLPAADMDGTSDPYIVFSAPFLDGSNVRTAVRPSTLDPVWDDSEVPEIWLTTNNPERIAQQFLRLTLYDYDAGMQDDFLANAVLPLAQLVSGLPRPIELTVTAGGLPAGKLWATGQIVWSAEAGAAPPMLMRARSRSQSRLLKEQKKKDKKERKNQKQKKKKKKQKKQRKKKQPDDELEPEGQP